MPRTAPDSPGRSRSAGTSAGSRRSRRSGASSPAASARPPGPARSPRPEAAITSGELLGGAPADVPVRAPAGRTDVHEAGQRERHRPRAQAERIGERRGARRGRGAREPRGDRRDASSRRSAGPSDGGPGRGPRAGTAAVRGPPRRRGRRGRTPGSRRPASSGRRRADPAHVRLVDAHPEGDRGAHDPRRAAEERVHRRRAAPSRTGRRGRGSRSWPAAASRSCAAAAPARVAAYTIPGPASSAAEDASSRCLVGGRGEGAARTARCAGRSKSPTTTSGVPQPQPPGDLGPHRRGGGRGQRQPHRVPPARRPGHRGAGSRGGSPDPTG